MTAFSSRIRTVAGWWEASGRGRTAGRWHGAPIILSPHEPDGSVNQAADARSDREKQIVRLIVHAFRRLGLRIADTAGLAIFYSEPDRQATVYLNDTRIALTTLMKLQQSGLATDYGVSIGRNHALAITFIVSSALDGTSTPP